MPPVHRRPARRVRTIAIMLVAGVVSATAACSTTPAPAPVSSAPEPVVAPAGPAALPPTTTTPTPTTPPPPGPKGARPDNGDVLARSGSGEGVFVVDNGTSQDALITLASGSRAIRKVYVRASATTTLRDIPDGTFVVYSSTGSGWNEDLEQFTAGRSASRFDDTFPFTTDDGQYTEWSITLQPVVGGTASAADVPVDSVPR